MLNAKKLNSLIAQSENLVVVKRNDGMVCVFSSFKDIIGNYRCSGWFHEIEIAEKNIGVYSGYTEWQINNYAKDDDWQIVPAEEGGWIRPEPFENMTKCQIAPWAEEECKKNGYNWYRGKIEMVGKTYNVDKDEGNLIMVNGWEFPRSAVIPVIDDENEMTDEELIAELQRRGRISEGKIIK